MPVHHPRYSAMSNSSESEPKQQGELPGFLQNPRPSPRRRCLTPLVASLQSSSDCSASMSDSSAQQEVSIKGAKRPT
jgi:hypothetical protein